MSSLETSPETPRHRQGIAWPPQAVRAWLYRVTLAALPILTGYGLLEDSKAALWAGLAAAILATGSAALNTPTGRAE